MPCDQLGAVERLAAHIMRRASYQPTHRRHCGEPEGQVKTVRSLAADSHSAVWHVASTAPHCWAGWPAGKYTRKQNG
jgi:hypothetical protein